MRGNKSPQHDPPSAANGRDNVHFSRLHQAKCHAVRILDLSHHHVTRLKRSRENTPSSRIEFCHDVHRGIFPPVPGNVKNQVSGAMTLNPGWGGFDETSHFQKSPHPRSPFLRRFEQTFALRHELLSPVGFDPVAVSRASRVESRESRVESEPRKPSGSVFSRREWNSATPEPPKLPPYLHGETPSAPPRESRIDTFLPQRRRGAEGILLSFSFFGSCPFFLFSSSSSAFRSFSASLRLRASPCIDTFLPQRRRDAEGILFKIQLPWISSVLFFSPSSSAFRSFSASLRLCASSCSDTFIPQRRGDAETMTMS